MLSRFPYYLNYNNKRQLLNPFHEGGTDFFLALMEAASSCGSDSGHKRYSGQQEIAPKKHSKT